MLKAPSFLRSSTSRSWLIACTGRTSGCITHASAREDLMWAAYLSVCGVSADAPCQVQLCHHAALPARMQVKTVVLRAHLQAIYLWNHSHWRCHAEIPSRACLVHGSVLPQQCKSKPTQRARVVTHQSRERTWPRLPSTPVWYHQRQSYLTTRSYLHSPC
jgi:hypothetical protein